MYVFKLNWTFCNKSLRISTTKSFCSFGMLFHCLLDVLLDVSKPLHNVYFLLTIYILLDSNPCQGFEP